jgi:hypothetical protein
MSKQNVKMQDAGKQVSNYSSNKSLFANEFDNTLRGWNASVKLFNQMYEAKNAALLDCMSNDGLTKGCFNMDYLKENLPGRFNSKGVLCTLKKVDEEGAKEIVKNGILEVKEIGGQIYAFCPMSKFTGRSFYNLFKSAITARKRGINETARRAKNAERAQRDADRIKKLQAELAKLTK